ncbi:uncharacterized protein MICPUCDRAFT_54944 [Micromonas pusilla CCMP1545]|uniref:Predicted protein n=1 Tax=Micromonas pusilla (strain CCMP1545) TaxID=564608 RepID=C1NAK0_MICPC|nr:uncharacterized protein MICPUCDRAFT_54944 [Micromonas pusilla CCMP1545]EEH50954.1 predicted protein [Micromonas pusilla CCMP1545]|eukprot:XP_003064974.1 predicted protein [Micromonas pusilla CCMP1545]
MAARVHASRLARFGNSSQSASIRFAFVIGALLTIIYFAGRAVSVHYNNSVKGRVTVPVHHKNSVKGRVTLCIPALPKDLLKNSGAVFRETLQSISEQSTPPYEVIIGLSESTTFEGMRLQSMFKRSLGQIPLRIVSTTERGSVGANRNRAAREAVTEYVSFFDADGDLMHPRRIELIENTFRLYSAALIVLHSYTKEKTIATEDTVSFDLISAKELCNINSLRSRSIDKALFQPQREWLLPDIHHGHLSVRTSLVKAKPFSEDFLGREDSQYINEVVENAQCSSAKSAVFIRTPLTLNYIPRSLQPSQ